MRRLSLVCCLLIILISISALARNPIRRAFFNTYPDAENTRLDALPSDSNHCGVCHFDFGGSGQRNAYGLAVEVAIGQLGDDEAAILSVENEDSDNDGYSNLIEITDTINFTNTPTFPGLRDDNIDQVVNIDPADLVGYLEPGGSNDTDPPVVTVLAPSGGETFTPGSIVTVSWTAEDPSGIAGVDILHSDDGGEHWRYKAKNLDNSGSWAWFVPNRPGAGSMIRVEARDAAANEGEADSPAFTITAVIGGTVPTSLRDFDLPGTQPLESGTLENPDVSCRTCHGDYSQDDEPWFAWQGSMMAHAMRDPIYLATLTIAEQDAPGVGDLCLRCHSPGGWQAAHSDDTLGGMMDATDRQGVQCDYCHRSVDPNYQAGVSPLRDLEILDELDEIPLQPANGQFITDPDPIRRGPRADAQADHEFLESPFHRKGDFCGTCHDVSNPAFVQDGDPLTYVPDAFDSAHPDGNLRNMAPIERTSTEWSLSTYANGGVYAPQFAGTKPDGMVESCQDCHMADIAGKSATGGPNRSDLARHDLTGGNYFIGDLLPAIWGGEVDATMLQAGKNRAIGLLQMAATLEATSEVVGGQQQLNVTVINETGHKLPSGYPEGRRIWLNVKVYDGGDALIYESGAYDPATGVLTHDDDAKIYEIKPGISHRLSAIIGMPAAPSFHFALNDTNWSDNRIPPRGFNNAAFMAGQCAPAGYSYADGQYHDLTSYTLSSGAARAEVTLNYQSTSKEYVEFLRDENHTDTRGQEMYDMWVAHGRCAPVVMASASLVLEVADAGDPPAARRLALLPNVPNPFNPVTRIHFELSETGPAEMAVYDAAGRRVRTLTTGPRSAGSHSVIWDGRDQGGRTVAAGTYFAVLRAEGRQMSQKMSLVK